MPCSPSSDSFDGVEAHLSGGSIGSLSGHVSDFEANLGEVCDGYCAIAEIISAAELKGVRMTKSDLVDNESESVNQSVVMFRGAKAMLVDAIYDSFESGASIEKMLKSLRSSRLPNGGGRE